MSLSQEILPESEIDRAAQEIAQAVLSADEILHKMTPDTAVDGLRAYVQNMQGYAKISSGFQGEEMQHELYEHLRDVYGIRKSNLSFTGAHNKLSNFTLENPDFPYQFEIKLQSEGQDVLNMLGDMNCSLHDLSQSLLNPESYKAGGLLSRVFDPDGCDGVLCDFAAQDATLEVMRLREALAVVEGLPRRNDLSPEEKLNQYMTYFQSYEKAYAKFSQIQRAEDDSAGHSARSIDEFRDIVQARTNRAGAVPPRILPDGGGHLLEVVRDHAAQKMTALEAEIRPSYRDDDSYEREYRAYLEQQRSGYNSFKFDMQTIAGAAANIAGLDITLGDLERISGYSVDYLERQSDLMLLESQCCVRGVAGRVSSPSITLGENFKTQAGEVIATQGVVIPEVTEVTPAVGFKR